MNATIIDEGIAVAQDPDTAWYEERRALALQMLDGRACFLCGQPCEIPDTDALVYDWGLLRLDGGPAMPLHHSCSLATGDERYVRLERDRAYLERQYAAAVRMAAA